MNFDQVKQSLSWTWPEAVLVAMILLVIIADLLKGARKGAVAALAIGGLGLAFLLVCRHVSSYGADRPPAPQSVFGGAYAIDGMAYFFKLAFLGAAIVVAVFSIPAIRGWPAGKGEYFALLLSCTFGMMLMASANDLLLMYLSLEFVSVTSYIMSGLLRKDRKSAEASLKYIIYGAGASGFMIYGMTFLYGMTGTLEVGELGRRLSQVQIPETVTLLTSVLIMAGFGYKIAAVPFHMWCPDVYEGAPTPVTAFFSVGPKAAGFAMLARFLWNAFPEGQPSPFEWRLVIAVLAVLTMTVGNLAALQQQNLKRLLAYSSIAHAGYLLVAFAAFTRESLAGLMFYLVVYIVMNLGAFLVVLVLEERHRVETVDGCRGLGWKSPGLCGLMTVFLVSLTGIPPTAGFIGKLLVFGGVVQHGLGPHRGISIALVVIAVLFSVVSLVYYARIVAAMFLVKPRDESPAPATGGAYGTLIGLLGAATIVWGIAWGWLHDLARAASESILTRS
jgi:NADH-quinone oxidoreductase subunit N